MHSGSSLAELRFSFQSLLRFLDFRSSRAKMPCSSSAVLWGLHAVLLRCLGLSIFRLHSRKSARVARSLGEQSGSWSVFRCSRSRAFLLRMCFSRRSSSLASSLRLRRVRSGSSVDCISSCTRVPRMMKGERVAPHRRGRKQRNGL